MTFSHLLSHTWRSTRTCRWADTLEWFRDHWLPSFDPNAGLTGLAKGTEDKIKTQVAGTGTAAE